MKKGRRQSGSTSLKGAKNASSEPNPLIEKLKPILTETLPNLAKKIFSTLQICLPICFRMLGRHGRIIRRLIFFGLVIFLSFLTVIISILKAPSGRDWVRKTYFENYNNKEFNLDTDLIFTKSKYEVETFIPGFPGRQPKADVKVLAPLDNPWRIFETPYFEKGTVVLLNISPTAGNDKWLKKGIMMEIAHYGYKPIAVNLPINSTGQINYFNSELALGKLLFDALHQMAIQHENTYLVFGGPVSCIVFPYLMKVRDLLDDPLIKPKKKVIPDNHFKGIMMVTPDFCNITVLDFEKYKEKIDEHKFWIVLNQDADDVVDIYKYRESFGTAEWFEVHEEISKKEERNSKMWPLKEQNDVFIKYFKNMVGQVDEVPSPETENHEESENVEQSSANENTAENTENEVPEASETAPENPSPNSENQASDQN